jgi:predicted Zn-dependent peptidase
MKQSVNKTVLKNGVRILTKKMPHARSVSMGVWVNVGARDESEKENGLSHLIEHMIFKGTKKRTAFQIAKQFDALGCNTNAFTGYESTCYHARVLDTHLKTVVDILSDIFLNSVFDEQELEKERAVIFQEIGMVEDSPEEYVHVLSNTAFWDDNPLGRSILGTKENILGFTSSDIQNFFKRFYQPNRIIISFAGNLSHNKAVDLIGPCFESVKPGQSFPERITPLAHSAINLHHRDSEQLHICIGTKGISITDPSRFAFSILNTVFGGNMSSRLFQNLREQRGLAYSVYSFMSSYIDTGMAGTYTGVNPEKAKESIELILKEMNQLKEVRIDQSELKDAKEYIKGNLFLASESIDNQMVRLAQSEINFNRHIPLETVADRIERVTAEDVLELTRVLFQPEHMSLTLLGPTDDKDSFKDILSL